MKKSMNVPIEERYAEAALARLHQLGYKNAEGSHGEEIKRITSVLAEYEMSKPKPSFEEADIVRPMQKIVTRGGITGVVLRMQGSIPVVYLDEVYGGYRVFDYQPDGKYRDDGGEHNLDLMDFTPLNLEIKNV